MEREGRTADAACVLWRKYWSVVSVPPAAANPAASKTERSTHLFPAGPSNLVRVCQLMCHSLPPPFHREESLPSQSRGSALWPLRLRRAKKNRRRPGGRRGPSFQTYERQNLRKTRPNSSQTRRPTPMPTRQSIHCVLLMATALRIVRLEYEKEVAGENGLPGLRLWKAGLRSAVWSAAKGCTLAIESSGLRPGSDAGRVGACVPSSSVPDNEGWE